MSARDDLTSRSCCVVLYLNTLLYRPARREAASPGKSYLLPNNTLRRLSRTHFSMYTVLHNIIKDRSGMSISMLLYVALDKLARQAAV